MADKPYIVGIAGASASGKTTLLHELRALFTPQELSIISQDNYYLPAHQHARDSNGHINFDLPQCIDLESFSRDILQLSEGKSISRKEYRFQHEDQYGDWLQVNPAPIIVVEGLFIFDDESIRNHFDLKIFIDTDLDICRERRFMRDTSERNIPEDFVQYQWTQHVRPSFERYLLPYKNLADLTINNNEHFKEGLNSLKNRFNTVLMK